MKWANVAVDMCFFCCSSCSREAIKERVQRYLSHSVQRQQHVSEIVIRQFNDVFLDQCVDSITVYDLSAVIQVCMIHAIVVGLFSTVTTVHCSVSF